MPGALCGARDQTYGYQASTLPTMLPHPVSILLLLKVGCNLQDDFRTH